MVTGFAAEDCGIERRHHEGFRHLHVKLKQIKATDIMLHYQDLKAKTQIYQSGIFEEIIFAKSPIFELSFQDLCPWKG